MGAACALSQSHTTRLWMIHDHYATAKTAAAIHKGVSAETADEAV
jgi:hypothetical protein